MTYQQTALVVARIGIAGSIAFTLYAGRRSPQHVLMIAMALWTAAPLSVLLITDRLGATWSPSIRSALHGAMLLITAGSLAAYVYDALNPPKAQAAFMYVVVPVISWAVIGIMILIGALRSRRT